MLRWNARGSSKAGMGLLEGLKQLEGAPLPAPGTSGGGSGSGTTSAADAMAQFSSSAKTVFGGLGGLGSTLGEGAAGAASTMRRFLGDEDVEAPAQATLSDEVNALCSLTWMQRIALFAMTFGAGVLMLMTSITFLPMLVITPHKFAAAFTMGNILCIVSTWLLTGPRAQLRAMFQPGRATAAALYVGSLVAVLLAATFGGQLRYPLVIVCLIGEVIALGWYALSYVPYGRTMISRATGMMGWAS